MKAEKSNSEKLQLSAARMLEAESDPSGTGFALQARPGHSSSALLAL